MDRCGGSYVQMPSNVRLTTAASRFRPSASRSSARRGLMAKFFTKGRCLSLALNPLFPHVLFLARELSAERVQGHSLPHCLPGLDVFFALLISLVPICSNCCSCVKCESRPPSRPSLRRRQNSAPSNVEPCTLWPQHLRQPFVLRGARGGTALLDLQLDGGASPPGHARLLLGV